MPLLPGRLNVKQLKQASSKFLDDTYNANVASVNAAIDLLGPFCGNAEVLNFRDNGWAR